MVYIYKPYFNQKTKNKQTKMSIAVFGRIYDDNFITQLKFTTTKQR